MSKQLRWALVAPKIPIHQQLDSISSSLSTIANNSQNLLKLGKQQLDCGITQLQNLQELNIKLVKLTSLMEKVAAQKVQPIPTQPPPPPGVPPTMPSPASPQLMGKFFCYLGPIPSSMEPNVMENPPGPGYNPVPTLKSNSLTVWDTQYHKMRSVSPTAFNEERLKAVNQAWAPQGFMQVDGRGLHRIYKDLEGGSSWLGSDDLHRRSMRLCYKFGRSIRCKYQFINLDDDWTLWGLAFHTIFLLSAFSGVLRSRDFKWIAASADQKFEWAWHSAIDKLSFVKSSDFSSYVSYPKWLCHGQVSLGYSVGLIIHRVWTPKVIPSGDASQVGCLIACSTASNMHTFTLTQGKCSEL